MALNITNFSEFESRFPNNEIIEQRDDAFLCSNGEGENSEYETAWFAVDTEELIDHPDML